MLTTSSVAFFLLLPEIKSLPKEEAVGETSVSMGETREWFLDCVEIAKQSAMKSWSKLSV